MFRFTGIWLFSLALIVLLAGSAAADPCPLGDLDGNCRVDWQDVLRFTRQWLDPPSICQEQEQGLLAHWRLDDNADNTAVVDSAGGHTGTAQQSTSVLHTTGQIDGALSFNGSSDYITVSGSDGLRFNSGTQDFSIFAWIKSATGYSSSTLIFDLRNADDDGWRFLYSSTEQIWLSIDWKDVRSSSLIQDTNWHFVGAVIDRDGNGQMYIDGLPDGNPVAISSEPMATTVDAAIGKSSYDASGYFDGLIDDVCIYDRALSADQVWTIAEMGHPQPLCADLIGGDGVDLADFAILARNWGQDWTGLLLVTIEPQAARDGGAQWRVDGGLWRDSGYTEQDVPIGQHTIEFKTGIAGWVRPADQQVQVDINQTTITSGTYTALTTANIVINEFMASNGSQEPLDPGELLDGDGESSDWIEIYNAHGQQVDISGWYLTDSENNLYKWQFPVGSAVLDDGDYLIVFASGINDANYPYIDPSGYYHTNFRLNVGGDYLALVAPDGATIVHDYNSCEYDVNEFGYPDQRRNYSYGIIDNNPDLESYFGPATPQAQNANTLDGIVADTKFSVDRGFYEVPFSVEITTETEGANIRYTLDCSEPTETYGTDYTGPIGVTGSASLRAIAFKTDYLPTNVDTHTYIFLDDVLTQSDDQSALGLPSVWINGTGTTIPGTSNTIMVREADYEIDPAVTLAKSDLTTIPSISIVMNADDWFHEDTGIYTNSIKRVTPTEPQWEKPGSVELIYPNPNVGEEFQLNAGVRITGELARWPVVNKKQGIRLLFKGDYGPTKLRSSIFPNSDVDRYDTIVMRSHWGCSWLQEPYLTTYYPEYTATWLNADPTGATYIRDLYALDCWRDTGHISSEGRFVHLYINSLYWGIYEVIERADASFNAEHRGGDKEDYDVIKGAVSIEYTRINGSLHSGERDTWDKLFSFFDFNGLSNTSTVTPVSDDDYVEVQKYLDVEAFADYMLTLWTIGRFDFPRKNWYAAAKRGLPGQPPEKKFIFYVWDSEASLWDLHTSTKARYLDSTGSSDTGPVRLFKRLVPNTEFKMLFAGRMQKFLFNDGALTPGANIDRFMVRANELDRAIVGESARWGDATITYADSPLTRDVEWVAERDRILNDILPERTAVVIEQLRDVDLYPNVNAPVFAINGSNQHGGHADSGAELSILVEIAETATLWYTLDGSDPRVSGISVPVEPVGSGSGGDITLLEEDAEKRILVPTVANGGDLLGTTWTGGDEPFDDSEWNDANYVDGKTGGVGYERGSGYQDYISYDVNDVMYGLQQTCYIRVPFIVSSNDLAGAESLSLKARYDDAFVAYINGVEVARTDFVPSPLEWDSGATDWTNPETTVFWTFDIFDHVNDLQAGDNILAIHLLNSGTTSSDLLMSFELEMSTNIEPPPSVEVIIGTLTSSTQVKARVLTGGGEWSALSEAVFAVGEVADSLRITEIMYHPQDAPAGNPDAEFIELKNIGPETINLSLVQFTNGVDYTFGGTELASGEYVVIVKDRTAFEDEYGFGINVAAGQYTGSLDNGGERIELEDAAGQTILNFRYRDGWCDITDGDGYSLIINDATGDPNNWDEKKDWSASTFLGGSPGQPDNGPRYGDVVINEVLAHSNADPNDWIELHNTTDGIIDITGWFLSDKGSNLMKYQIPAATIPAHGYIVFTQDAHFGSEFKLSENGETVYLSSGLDIYGNLTGYRQQEDFGASESEIAFGRYRKSTGTYNFVAMSGNTPGPSYEGAANAYPKVDPIVINEIMYNAGPGKHNEEYIELYNLSGSAVTLYNDGESEPWKFTNGIDFTFPASPSEVTIDPGECLLVVKDLAAFTARYGSMPAGVEVVGPYDGLLANDGEKLEISKPGDEDGGTRYYIRIDRVSYSDGWHPDNCPGDVDLWPIEPDGDGDSLNRIFAQYYGNDPNNWQAAPPSPGVP